MIHTDGVRTIANAPAADVTRGMTTEGLAERLSLPAKSAAPAASWGEDEMPDPPQTRPLTHFYDYLGRIIAAGLYVTLKMRDSELEGQLCPDLSTGGVTAIREVAIDLITVVPNYEIHGVKFEGHDADSIDFETPLAPNRYDFDY